ncbi:MAG: hypothetical protein U0105_07795 [Candidatus Obscuribacterales bacterium]
MQSIDGGSDMICIRFTQLARITFIPGAYFKGMVNGRNSSRNSRHLASTGATTARRQHSLHDRSRIRASHLVDVSRRFNGCADVQVSGRRFSALENPNNDHLVFSKGHACPLLYSMYKAAGAIDDKELMSLRKFGSRLEGHPVPQILLWSTSPSPARQGLLIAVGIALDAKYLFKSGYRTGYCSVIAK